MGLHSDQQLILINGHLDPEKRLQLPASNREQSLIPFLDHQDWEQLVGVAVEYSAYGEMIPFDLHYLLIPGMIYDTLLDDDD